MKYILETERLRLREFKLTDTAFIIELLNSPGWLQFIGDRNVKTEAQAISYLQNGALKSYAENGYGLWCVEQKADTKPIGMCGLLNRHYLDHPDIGFALLPGYYGTGYAFEIASAAMAHAADRLHIPVISGITLADNARSVRLLEKLGLRFIKPIKLSDSGEELLLYST